uniref:Uncharacterized protein n=1 Tax=Pyxicephalus adspersus TaxID=30357 RepID=A0AAV2ZYY3_PYXAD|nr:TPA: hypothetical protein GDO54_014714 [Pyxicephalus adspersus]
MLSSKGSIWRTIERIIKIYITVSIQQIPISPQGVTKYHTGSYRGRIIKYHRGWGDRHDNFLPRCPFGFLYHWLISLKNVHFLPLFPQFVFCGGE